MEFIASRPALREMLKEGVLHHVRGEERRVWGCPVSASIFQPPPQPPLPKAVRRLHQTYRALGSCRILKAPRHMPWIPGPSGGSGPGQDMVTVSREQAL